MLKTQRWILCAVFSLAFFAAAARFAVHANAIPRGYVIAEITITNPEAYKAYLAKVAPVVTQFGGKYLVRGGFTLPVEGAPPAGRVVVIEFESLTAARRFEYSPEYQAIVPLRQKSATSRVFLVDGAEAR